MSPPSQSARPSQSCGAPSLIGWPSAARSDSVVEVVGVGEVLGDEEGVLVGRLRRRQDRDALLLGQRLERRERGVGVVARHQLGVGTVLLGVEEVGDAGEVVGDDVDVAAAQLGQVDVARGDQLGLHGVALVLEELLVDRGQHLHLGEVLAADDDRALVGAAAGPLSSLGAGVLERVARRRPAVARSSADAAVRPECASDAHGCTTFCVPRSRSPARVRWAPFRHPRTKHRPRHRHSTGDGSVTKQLRRSASGSGAPASGRPSPGPAHRVERTARPARPALEEQRADGHQHRAGHHLVRCAGWRTRG